MIATKPAAAPARQFKFPPEVAAAERIEKAGPLMIDVKAISRGDNPREEFDAAELQALADSMTSLSLLAPLTVTSAGPGAYRLIAGERRLRAAKLAGWRRVPCYVVSGPPELLAEMTFAENLLRVDLNLIEKARGIERLNRPIADGGAGLSLATIAGRLGHKEAWAVKMTALLKLPAKWQKKLAAGELMFRQGYALSSYADRPDVLAAVEADLAANPADWQRADDFDWRLVFVVKKLDGLTSAASADAAENGAASPQGMNAASDQFATLSVARRSSAVNHVVGSGAQSGDDGHLIEPPPAVRLIGSSDDPVSIIIEQLDRITTAAQLERVQRAMRKHEARIARG